MTEIAGVDALRWDDIEKVKGHFSGSASTSTAKGKDEVDAQLANYQCDYAKSNRSTCKVCENKITKGEIRVAIMMDDDTKFVGAKIPKWHHLDCFVEKKKEEPELSNIAENDISGTNYISIIIVINIQLSFIFLVKAFLSPPLY